MSLRRRPSSPPQPDPRSSGLPGPSRHPIGAFAPLATILILGILLGGAALLSGCATTEDSKPEVTSDGLVMVRKTNRTRLWVKPDHHLGRYDDILVSGVGFSYSREQDHLQPTEEEQVGKMLVGAIASITAGSPVGQSNVPGPCVVALQLGLKDIRLHIGGSEGSSTSLVSSFGSATMIVEFRDSTSDVPLVRYAANRGLGSGQGSGQRGADLGRLGRALGKMVTDMTEELQAIVPDTTVRPETECNNGIYKLTGRG